MHKKKLVYWILFIVIIFAISHALSHYITLENIQNNLEFLRHISQQHPLKTILLFILSQTLITILPTPGEALLTITGGFMFGINKGIIFALIGTTLGSLITFYLTRFFGGPQVKKYYKKEYQDLNKHLKIHGKYYLLALRLLVPSSVVNVIAGLTPVTLSTFLITTMLGVLPITSMYVVAGEKIKQLSSLKDVLTPNWFALLFGLAFLLCLPPLYSLLKKSRLFTS